MFFVYNIVYTLGFILLLPRFLFDAIFKGKYAAGFRQRLGFVPVLERSEKKTIWLHCVSVGEVNAARPLALQITERFPGTRLVVSTTTRTGHELARTAFADVAERVFYFPFDWRSTVRRALRRINPAVILLTETEIWFNFIHETYKTGTRVAIVNGRVSARSFRRYGYIRDLMERIFGYLDLALMQENADATRLMSLGMRAGKVKVTGNLKFDHDLDVNETRLTQVLKEQFGITAEAPLILAASTHSPEESWLLDAFKNLSRSSNAHPRLMIAPRHPERFSEVAELIRKSGFDVVRRSEAGSSRDKTADVILLDSIGELRAAYPLAEMVFVGGSLIERGGQSIFEPAAAGKAIITGPHMSNFDAAVREFLERKGLVQLPVTSNGEVVPALIDAFNDLLSDTDRRKELAANALAAMQHNRGAVHRTLDYLEPLITKAEAR
jgi:3-deoxy-D-manno-octulosonic-acid transferase